MQFASASIPLFLRGFAALREILFSFPRLALVRPVPVVRNSRLSLGESTSFPRAKRGDLPTPIVDEIHESSPSRQTWSSPNLKS